MTIVTSLRATYLKRLTLLLFASYVRLLLYFDKLHGAEDVPPPSYPCLDALGDSALWLSNLSRQVEALPVYICWRALFIYSPNSRLFPVLAPSELIPYPLFLYVSVPKESYPFLRCIFAGVCLGYQLNFC